jgi:hypothetical protein
MNRTLRALAFRLALLLALAALAYTYVPASAWKYVAIGSVSLLVLAVLIGVVCFGSALAVITGGARHLERLTRLSDEDEELASCSDLQPETA